MNSQFPELTSYAGTQSLESFLIEMEKSPQTRKWDALLVFDKREANRLLAQEYVDRITVEETFFPTLPNDNVDAGNGIEYVMLGLVLDKPRLSFENASIQDSKCKLQMRLVGGKQLEVTDRVLDGKHVRSIIALTVYNVAAHGVLDMNIRLEATAGSVDSSGKVLLDLGNGFEHQFSGGGTAFERERLGLYFKKVLESWKEDDAAITQFPLSELKGDADPVIDPGIFGIRTHAAPGATLLGTDRYGNGAVVVFIAMDGNPAGDYPHDDKSMLYMLPESSAAYSSNLVLSNKFLLSQVFKSGFDRSELTRGKFDLKQLAGDRYALVANATAHAFTRFTYRDSNADGGAHPWFWSFEITSLNTAIFSPGSDFTVEGRKLKARWSSQADIGTVIYGIRTGYDSPIYTSYPTLQASAVVDATYEFSITTTDGINTLKFQATDFNVEVVALFDGDKLGTGKGPDDARSHLPALQAEVSKRLKSAIEEAVVSFKDMTFEIDALRLNNLLFSGDNVVEPRDVSVPTDLTLLGNLAPKRTALVISPAEPIVASGQQIDFSTEPANARVTWTVENLAGETGATGAFNDPSTGRYTAPSDPALLTEGQRRLIVTATSGDRVSKTLVSVVPSQVTVNPWVATVGLGRSYKISAATPDFADVRWDSPAFGSIVLDDDPLNPSGFKYTAPDKLPKRQAGEPEHYRSLRMETLTVQPASGGASATIDMLIIGQKNENYWLEPQANDDGSVALPFYRLNMDSERVRVPDPVEWTVLRGSGTVDPTTRVYTPAENADDQYVIISAYSINDDTAANHDVVILPLPFVSARRHAEILNVPGREV